MKKTCLTCADWNKKYGCVSSMAHVCDARRHYRPRENKSSTPWSLIRRWVIVIAAITLLFVEIDS